MAAMCKVSIEIGWNRKIIHQNLGKSPEHVPVAEVERWSHKWFGCYLRLWRGSHSRCAEIFNRVGAGQTPRRNVVEEWNAQCPVFAAPHFPGGIGMNSNEAHISIYAYIFIYIYLSYQFAATGQGFAAFGQPMSVPARLATCAMLQCL